MSNVCFFNNRLKFVPNSKCINLGNQEKIIDESEILFVTTTLYTKWLYYQSSIVKSLFPKSKHIWVDGTKNWPNSWFHWINQVKNRPEKYYVLVDEDFFITDKQAFLRCIEYMENSDCNLLGCPDGFHQFRQHNPVAINTFLMFGRIKDLSGLDFSKIQFEFNESNNEWENSFSLKYKEDYSLDFNYHFPAEHGCRYDNYEPYYAFMWLMKEKQMKFSYLYPDFDREFKVTSPKFSPDAPSIGYHMWYTRQWDSRMDVLGTPNIERYLKMESFLNQTFNFNAPLKKLRFYLKRKLRFADF